LKATTLAQALIKPEPTSVGLTSERCWCFAWTLPTEARNVQHAPIITHDGFDPLPLDAAVRPAYRSSVSA
jgi:hypothetical protein